MLDELDGASKGAADRKVPRGVDAMRSKAIFRVVGRPHVELVRFTLADDGTLTWQYGPEASEMMQGIHAEMGIISRSGERIKRSEGRAFFDALDFYYARSSTLCVVPLDERGRIPRARRSRARGPVAEGKPKRQARAGATKTGAPKRKPR